MKNTFDLLEQYSRFSSVYKTSEEMAFFMKHRDALASVEQFAYLYDADASDFLMIRANIIIRSLFNKKEIEKAIKELSPLLAKDQITKFRVDFKERIDKLPCYSTGKDRIYVTFFSRAINLMYLTSPEEFNKFPFNVLEKNYSSSIIDAFDTYGADIFDSVFTKLVKISTNGREIAYYHYDFKCIYIVNNQGRLDNKIYLFDEFLEEFDTTNMIERIKPVIDAYFANDRDEFIKKLNQNGFISEKMVYLIAKNRNRKHDI